MHGLFYKSEHLWSIFEDRPNKKSGLRFDFQLFRSYYMSTDYKITIDSKFGGYLNRVLP